VGPTHTLLSQNKSYLYSIQYLSNIYLSNLSSESRVSTYYSKEVPNLIISFKLTLKGYITFKSK